jgi:lipoyl-dependent peroxiredoxin subunit D
VDSHEKVVRGKGATEDLVVAVVRVAAVIHAIGTVLDTVAAQSAKAAEPALSRV